jgi:hypothetical protein
MSAAKQSVGIASRLRAFVNSPTGPKTTHFWGTFIFPLSAGILFVLISLLFLPLMSN